MFMKSYLAILLTISVGYAAVDTIPEERLQRVSNRMKGERVTQAEFVSNVKRYLSNAPYSTISATSQFGQNIDVLLKIVHDQFGDLMHAVYFVANNIHNTSGYRVLEQHFRFRPKNELFYGRGIVQAQGEEHYACASEVVSDDFTNDPKKLASLSNNAVQGSIHIYKTVCERFLDGRPATSLTFKESVTMMAPVDVTDDEAAMWRYEARKKIFLGIAALFKSID